MAEAKEKGVDICLPVDFITSSKFGEDGEISSSTLASGIPDGMMGLDCGPESIKANAEVQHPRACVRRPPLRDATRERVGAPSPRTRSYRNIDR